MRRLRVVFVSVLFGVGVPLSVRADAPPKPLAETLFREGMAAFDQGQYEEACPKLAESEKLDPGSGTLLALAACHEAQGKTASAWSEFLEAVSLSRQAGRKDRALAAEQRAQHLEPLLLHLVIEIGRQERDLTVELDGVAVAPAAWGIAIPIDPGVHRLAVHAPGKLPFSVDLTMAPADKRRVQRVPPLQADAPAAVTPAPVPPPQPPGRSGDDSTRRLLGFGAIGLGVIGIGVGAGFGVHSLSVNADAERLCPSTPCSDREGVSRNESARSSAWIANLSIGGGLLFGAVGAYLVLTSTSRVRVAAGPGEVTLTAHY